MTLQQYLSTVFQNKTNSHFYLFTVPGSLEAALKVIGCESYSACGKCPGCLSGTLVEWYQVASEDGGKIKDAEVEELLKNIKTETSARYKVITISDADRLTERAQNRLLKSLENTGGDVVFLLETMYPGSLLETVVSRAVRPRLPVAGATLNTKESELVKTLLTGDATKSFQAMKKYAENKPGLFEELTIYIERLSDIYREAVKNRDDARAEACYETIRVADDVIKRIDKNANFELNIEVLAYALPSLEENV